MRTKTTPEETRELIVKQAKALGLDSIRFTSATLPQSTADNLSSYIKRGHHGDMTWMEERTHERSHPQHLWPQAKSVIVLGINYGPDHNPLDNLAHKTKANISVYARNKDYHDVLKKKIRQLASWIATTFGHEVKIFVDTAPVMEKPLAQQAGLGWQGKHTNLISREFGSWLFLGEIFTTLDLPPNKPESDHCGTCTRCLNVCPTGALINPHQIDARLCISYLTIENKSHIPHEFRPLIGNRIYGCDDCLAICPWNRFARQTSTEKLLPSEQNILPELETLAKLDDPAFRTRFSGSPIKRIGRNRFIRNVLIAIGNSNNPELLNTVIALLDDASPLVRAAAIYALARLAPETIFTQEKNRRAPAEPDAHIKKEWEHYAATLSGCTKSN